MPLSDDQLISLVRKDDLLSPEQVRQAREASRMTGKPLLEVIRERRWLDDAEMAHLEGEAAIVRPQSAPAAGQSATFIGSLAMLEGTDPRGPTVVPGLPAEADRPTAVPAMRGATPAPPLRRPEPDPAAAPEPEAPMGRGALLVAAIVAAAIIVAMVAGLGRFVRSGRKSQTRSSMKQSPSPLATAAARRDPA